MIAIDSETAVEFLAGIGNHARAGNFDQAARQAESLIGALDEASQSDGPHRNIYNDVLPLVRELPALAAKADKAAMLDVIHTAVRKLHPAVED